MTSERKVEIREMAHDWDVVAGEVIEELIDEVGIVEGRLAVMERERDIAVKMVADHLL